MVKKIRVTKLNVIILIIWLLLIMYVLAFNGYLPIKSSLIVVSFLLFNLIVNFFPSYIRYSLPMIIYRITGLIRYVVIPIVMVKQDISLSYSMGIKFLMILELVAILIGTFIFNKKNNVVKNNNEKKQEEITNSKIILGLPSLLVMLIGIILIIYNKSYIERYLTLGLSNSSSVNMYGGFALLISCFSLLFFIGCLKFIKNKLSISDIFKIIISLMIGVIYIKGSSITGDNVSRWSMIITGLITYIYLKRLYPNHTKKLILFLVVIVIFTMTFASALKFSWNNNYKSFDGMINEYFDFKSLNAYFAGPKNMSVALELKDELNNSNISKIKIFISDTFGNLPLLNTFLSDKNYQSNTLFNYKYYYSYLAVDQIMPYSCQLFNIFGLIFFIFEIIQIYLSYYFYFVCKKEYNFLNIYCCVYLSFVLSLVNCVNYSILMQTLWIHILPIFIINKFNNKAIIN